jgi:hypothetical protein
MKRKLQLNRETVRLLQTQQLEDVQGGTRTKDPWYISLTSCNISCGGTCDYTCLAC